MKNLLIQTPLNSFLLVYSLITLSSAVKSYRENKNKYVFFNLFLAVGIKYILVILALMSMSLHIDFKPITFTYNLGQTSFLKAITFVDLICFIGGIIAYRKKSYKTLLILVFIAVLFQYLGLVL
ncbi:hypothetical protein SAMN00017477_1339 [Peptoniphilus asaccharolyticus DSM 20463]|uniref:Uncharacterized protein n=1 Tax=Peptoniphilus asaccharolyticus DSM 20463 TaxID=573058 RepID=A0A1W1V447_PEPAS|nr:hypothetical protein [Peptoniphilus asaccharolyticus]MBL7576285.1 hypothetical protein [Peptoniphilus asaccharolyticus]SMB88098.1 hypothetical protein SAMN00017477_1339 [Peptoniphilus asaccharolyticus DSM 20463]